MADTSLEIVAKSTDDKKITTTISYVNDSVSGATLKQFGQMLNALTDNTYEESVRVSKVHLDTETYAPAKQVPTLRVTDDGGGKLGTITYTGDGSLATAGKADYTINGSMLQGGNGSTTYEGIIYATETDNYYQAWAIIPQLTGGPE